MNSRKKWKNRYYKIRKKEQKLIKKLEGEHIITKTKYSETLSPFQYGRLEVIEEILEIVKGEKK